MPKIFSLIEAESEKERRKIYQRLYRIGNGQKKKPSQAEQRAWDAIEEAKKAISDLIEDEEIEIL